MTPIDWALRPLKRYAMFRGRASRAEFWWFSLATTACGFVIEFADKMVGNAGVLSAIFNLGLAIPSIAVTVRRLQTVTGVDGGCSSWLCPSSP